ncbi:MAG: hypothetical protein EAZ55_01340 [Cytophagales bacterium]|nr:MAG: hypothetical protein EAZ55_01340 [Cytophagales bacterium]
MPKNEQLDELFAQKLGNLERTPPAALWAQLEEKIAQQNAMLTTHTTAKKRHRIGMVYWSAAATFVGLLVWIGSNYYPQNNSNLNYSTAMAQKAPNHQQDNFKQGKINATPFSQMPNQVQMAQITETKKTQNEKVENLIEEEKNRLNENQNNQYITQETNTSTKIKVTVKINHKTAKKENNNIVQTTPTTDLQDIVSKKDKRSKLNNTLREINNIRLGESEKWELSNVQLLKK